jgi:uncharacterized protein (DUF1697 family)
MFNFFKKPELSAEQIPTETDNFYRGICYGFASEILLGRIVAYLDIITKIETSWRPTLKNEIQAVYTLYYTNMESNRFEIVFDTVEEYENYKVKIKSIYKTISQETAKKESIIDLLAKEIINGYKCHYITWEQFLQLGKELENSPMREIALNTKNKTYMGRPYTIIGNPYV